MKLRSQLALLFACITLASCSTEVEETPPAAVHATIASDIPSDPGKTSATTYYRFSDSSIVTGTDTLTSKWDIGFRSTTILINGGSSGTGNGGAIISTGDFSSIKEAPQTGYRIDSIGAPAITTGSGNGWYNYDPNTNMISPIPGRVLIIRGGDGKYTKVQIVSYYKGAPQSPDVNSTPRYYSFRYVHQPDGSTKLE